MKVGILLKRSRLSNCSKDSVPCSVECCIARARGDKRPCFLIRLESDIKYTLLLLIVTLCLLYYAFVKGK